MRLPLVQLFEIPTGGKFGNMRRIHDVFFFGLIGYRENRPSTDGFHVMRLDGPDEEV